LEPRLLERFGHLRLVKEIRTLLAEAREQRPLPSREQLQRRLERRLSLNLKPVINATGVLLHTNLGRAPCSEGAREAVAKASSWLPLEIDLETGRRGERGLGVERRLEALTGAEAALVVNNCAAAVMLCLSALAQGRGVLISRAELVEIGGGFRIPEVLEQSGARLIELGTTNRSRVEDYQAAINPEVALIMRVHSSNFRQIGFVQHPSLKELVALPLPVLVDLGSGALEAIEDEPTLPEALSAGAELVCISGDKLLGGPQAGLILGQRRSIERLRRHPLTRALRPGKLILAALEGTLDDWLRGRPIPVWEMIKAPMEMLRSSVERWRAALVELEAEVLEVEGCVGGGSLPGRRLPSFALAISAPSPRRLAEALRQGEPPVLGRLKGGRLLLDARSLSPLGQDEALLEALRQALLNLKER